MSSKTNTTVPADAPITEAIVSEVLQVAPGTTLRAAAAKLRGLGVSFATVGVGDRIDGVITERDLVQSMVDGLDPDAVTVDAIESAGLKWATTAMTVGDVADEMLTHAVRHVLVCDTDGRLAGVASMRQLLRRWRR